jgi:hypothetical protein
LIPFERKHFEVCGNVNVNVGEYNRSGSRKEKKQLFALFFTTIFEMQQKGLKSSHDSGCHLDGVHKRAAVYVQSFRLITGRLISKLHDIYYEVTQVSFTICPNVPKWPPSGRIGKLIHFQEYKTN